MSFVDSDFPFSFGCNITSTTQHTFLLDRIPKTLFEQVLLNLFGFILSSHGYFAIKTSHRKSVDQNFFSLVLEIDLIDETSFLGTIYSYFVDIFTNLCRLLIQPLELEKFCYLIRDKKILNLRKNVKLCVKYFHANCHIVALHLKPIQKYPLDFKFFDCTKYISQLLSTYQTVTVLDSAVKFHKICYDSADGYKIDVYDSFFFFFSI